MSQSLDEISADLKMQTEFLKDVYDSLDFLSDDLRGDSEELNEIVKAMDHIDDAMEILQKLTGEKE